MNVQQKKKRGIRHFFLFPVGIKKKDIYSFSLTLVASISGLLKNHHMKLVNAHLLKSLLNVKKKKEKSRQETEGLDTQMITDIECNHSIYKYNRYNIPCNIEGLILLMHSTIVAYYDLNVIALSVSYIELSLNIHLAKINCNIPKIISFE